MSETAEILNRNEGVMASGEGDHSMACDLVDRYNQKKHGDQGDHNDQKQGNDDISKSDNSEKLNNADKLFNERFGLYRKYVRDSKSKPKEFDKISKLEVHFPKTKDFKKSDKSDNLENSIKFDKSNTFEMKVNISFAHPVRGIGGVGRV